MFRGEEAIRRDLALYIERHGGKAAEWYVGLALDARHQLFWRHKVDRQPGSWIIRRAASPELARRLLRYFTGELGTDGSPEPSQPEAVAVYAYRKSPGTEP